MQHCTMDRNQEDEKLSEITDKLGENLTLESSTNHEHKHDDVVYVIDDEEDEDFEFSFAGGDLNSPVSADEAFLNGQIRPIFTFTDEKTENSDEAAVAPSYAPLVKKVFVVSSSAENDDVAEGPYCAWSPAEIPATSPEMSQKSNSTGFSRLWRMKDLLVRSNSDGKDTFVFLTPKEVVEKKKSKKVVNLGRINVERRNNEGETMSSSTTTMNVGGEREKKKKGKKAAVTASVAAYEALYGKKEKRNGGGKSYLPYRQDLVGFFTNVNGLTRNVHPY